MTTRNNFDEMNKDQLRAACKKAGVAGYGKLNNDEMRGALRAHAGASSEPASPVVTTTPAADVPAASPVVPATAEKPARVKQEERNGVRRPAPGGKCAAVWDAMDLMHVSGKVPTSADAKQWAEANGANVSNATQEAARWRKFNGLTAQSKTAVSATA